MLRTDFEKFLYEYDIHVAAHTVKTDQIRQRYLAFVNDKIANTAFGGPFMLVNGVKLSIS